MDETDSDERNRQSDLIFTELRRDADRMSNEKKKEFDVRSVHPARGTRDAIVLESERERPERWTIEFNYEIDLCIPYEPNKLGLSFCIFLRYNWHSC